MLPCQHVVGTELRFSHRDCGRCPSVSLSHSGGWVACAITDAGAIGVDIEAHTSGRDFSGIAGAVFGPDEQRQVAAHGASGFYRVWTLKEAMAKASGGGIVEVADRTDRVAKDPKEGFWRADIGITSWWLAHAQMSGLSMSLAIREA